MSITSIQEYTHTQLPEHPCDNCADIRAFEIENKYEDGPEAVQGTGLDKDQ